MYIIREIKGIPQVFDMKDSTLRLLPYEVKEIASKEVNDEVKKRVSQGYVTLIEKPKPEKNTSSTKSTVTKEETN
jgi:hypothetical protein